MLSQGGVIPPLKIRLLCSAERVGLPSVIPPLKIRLLCFAERVGLPSVIPPLKIRLLCFAERVGFEPTVPEGTRALQARQFNRSCTFPD
jgi:hypothetical protein